MQTKKPLYVYVIAVAAVWAIILGATHYLASAETFHTFSSVCGGFAIGMLAMYVAAHFYRFK